MSEHKTQSELFKMIDAAIAANVHPVFETVYAIPNGGLRNKLTAYKLKLEGVRPGVWDISVDYASIGLHGLKIEMKYGKNKLTREQKKRQMIYAANGYATEVCYSAKEAFDVICNYAGVKL